MLKASTVSIVHEDAQRAGRDVASELLDRLGAKPDLVLLFASATYDAEQVVAGIFERLDSSTQLVGCSSYAEINAEEALTGSVTAMGFLLGDIQCKTAIVEDSSEGSFAVGKALAEQVRDFAPDLFIVLPDGIKVNSSPFLQGAQSVLGEKFPIVGGVAADDAKFTRTVEFHGNRVIAGGAVGVALKGKIEIVTAARSGWYAVGATRTATKVENGKIIRELDGRPALNFYQEYLGSLAAKLETAGLEFPLGIVGGIEGRERIADEQILVVRAIQGVDESKQALLSSGDVPEGAEVRMTRATKDDLLGAAESATTEVTNALPGASVALFFDCMGRKLVLGARYKEEIERAMSALGDDVAKIGFYTYGELSPVQGKTLHHDETFTIALLKA